MCSVTCSMGVAQSKHSPKKYIKKGEAFCESEHLSCRFMRGVLFYQMLTPLLCFIMYPADTVQNLEQGFTL
jgi:hypothetical protein